MAEIEQEKEGHMTTNSSSLEEQLEERVRECRAFQLVADVLMDLIEDIPDAAELLVEKATKWRGAYAESSAARADLAAQIEAAKP